MPLLAVNIPFCVPARVFFLPSWSVLYFDSSQLCFICFDPKASLPPSPHQSAAGGLTHRPGRWAAMGPEADSATLAFSPEPSASVCNGSPKALSMTGVVNEPKPNPGNLEQR